MWKSHLVQLGRENNWGLDLGESDFRNQVMG